MQRCCYDSREDCVFAKLQEPPSCCSDREHAPGGLPYKSYGGARLREYWEKRRRSPSLTLTRFARWFFSVSLLVRRLPRRLVLWAWLEFAFTSKRYQFYNNTLSPVIRFFSAQYPKRCHKSFSCRFFFQAEHPKRFQNHVFNS